MMLSNGRLFRPIDERINLLIPIGFLVAIVAGLPGPAKLLSADAEIGNLLSEVLVDVLLLNVTHNAFTVMMLVSFPEMREWLNRQKGGGRGFLQRAALIFFSLCLLFGLGIAGFVPYFRELVLPLSRFFPIQHALAQSLGLSLLYNGRSAAFGERPAKWLEKSERYLVWILIALTVSTVWVATKFEFLGVSFERLNLKIVFSAALTVSICLMIVALLHPQSTRINKTLFAFRYPVWALSVFSPLAVWATRAIHGLEYLFVVRKMASNSQFTAWKSVAIYVLGATAVFALVRVFYFSYAQPVIGAKEKGIDPLLILASISTAFSYLHYYLDRQLFLMRRQDNRELVAPLLRD
jgi:hypothetical protein